MSALGQKRKGAAVRAGNRLRVTADVAVTNAEKPVNYLQLAREIAYARFESRQRRRRWRRDDEGVGYGSRRCSMGNADLMPWTGAALEFSDAPCRANRGIVGR